jgi:hypothetical protein
MKMRAMKILTTHDVVSGSLVGIFRRKVLNQARGRIQDTNGELYLH